MNCPINAVRDFKAARQAEETAADNVVNIRGDSSIAAVHFARADEADLIEVTIQNDRNETITCEEVTMKNNNESLNVNASPIADAVKDAINTQAAEAAAEPEVQVTTVSVTDAMTRYTALRRKSILTSVVGHLAVVGGVVAGAALNGRDVKRAAISGVILSTASVAMDVRNKSQQEEAKRIADNASEEAYQAAVHVNKAQAVTSMSLLGTLGVMVGAFIVRKAVSNDAE